MRSTRFLGFGGPVVVSAIVLNMLVAHASGPYITGQAGYDISYPQCSTPTNALPSGAFGIVGVTNGRPFTSYTPQCFARLYTHAAGSGTPSLYFNTGYAVAYRKDITPACSAGPNQAWRIGCSEADYAASHAGGRNVAMWWLDVEVGNSWSSSNHTLNQQTIQGAVDRLSGTGLVGVYSTASSWNTITGGGFSPTGSSADWVAGQGGSCPGTSFDTKSVWLSQYVSQTDGFDHDNAC